MKIILNNTELDGAHIHKDYITDPNEDYMYSVVAALKIDFTSVGDFSEFTKQDGSLDNEKLFMAILRKLPREIEL